MAKRKSKAVILAADGTGGMEQIRDRRFDRDDWPIHFEVPKEQADTWLQYLSAECGRRGWSSTSLQQHEAKENSGSITVNTGAAGQPQLAIVWERKLVGPIKVRARSIGSPEIPLDQAAELFRLVNEQSETGATESFYHGGQLSYDGLAWRGELWLNDSLRLGPASKLDETALIGPRVIIVSALINGIDLSHATSTFAIRLRELSVFLSVVLGIDVRVSPNRMRSWVWTTNGRGQVECDLRNIGYFETNWPPQMPLMGQTQPVPFKAVHRPDFSESGIDGSQNEEHLPEDTVELWQGFTQLSPALRRQFLQAGSLWQLALSLDYEHQTTRFALMVAACEALKPSDIQFKNHNIYHVVEALLGKPTAGLLQEQWFRPQDVRNAHLHRGVFRGSEFIRRMMMSSFQDPTFDRACRLLMQIAQGAIIEWLRRGAIFTMPLLKRK